MFNLNINSLEYKLRIAQEKVEDTISEVIQKAVASNCTISVKSGKRNWIGSGFHLGDGYVATASHVVPPELINTGATINATFDGKVMFPLQLLASDPNVDSAILINPQIAGTIPPCSLGDSNSAKIGEIIAVISSPEGWHDTATVGRISNIHQSLGEANKPAWNDIIFIDADILQGSSGGMTIGTDGLVYGSIMGVTGQHAEVGIGQRAICPSNKISVLLQSAKK